MNDNRGTSLVITRTKRGQDFFDHIKESLEYKEEYDEAIKHNFAEHRSVSRPEKRDNFYNDLNILSFEQMGRKYGVTTYVEEIRQKIKRLLYKIIKSDNAEIKSNDVYGMMLTFKR